MNAALLWQTVTWDVARAGGFTAYILSTLAVAVGLALSMQLQSPSRWPRLLNSELHNFLTLLALVFTVVHVMAVIADPFTNFGLNEIFIPFVSHYRPIWMALGIVALYLGIAIGISTLLRSKIGYAWWRRLHVLTLLIFGLVTVHGIATGSDTQTLWGILIYGASVALVGGLLARRLLIPATQRGKRHPIIAYVVGLVTVACVVFTIFGPLRPGWSALAGGTSSASAASLSQSVSPSQNGSDPYASGFSASIQGTLAQNGPDASGAETLNISTTLSNGAQGVLTIVLQGTQNNYGDDGRGLSVSMTQVSLGTNATSPLYQGQVTNLRTGDRRWRLTAVLAKAGANATQIQVQIDLSIDGSGQVTGTIQGISAQGQSQNPSQGVQSTSE